MYSVRIGKVWFYGTGITIITPISVGRECLISRFLTGGRGSWECTVNISFQWVGTDETDVGLTPSTMRFLRHIPTSPKVHLKHTQHHIPTILSPTTLYLSPRGAFTTSLVHFTSLNQFLWALQTAIVIFNLTCNYIYIHISCSGPVTEGMVFMNSPVCSVHDWCYKLVWLAQGTLHIPPPSWPGQVMKAYRRNLSQPRCDQTKT